MKIIRRMDEGDIESVADIEHHSLSPWSKEQIAAELSHPDSISLIAEECGNTAPIGWCCARTTGPEAELLKIAVLADCRQAGYGSFLLTELCEQLLARKVETVFLEVRSQNLAAIRLYVKYGFAEVGVRPNYYRQPKDNALIFKKELLYSRC